jgi:site-specific DNA-methyltransferase (adenine-specific)
MIKLINNDCLNILPSIETGSVDMVCADMPYGTTRCKWDSCIDLDALWPELKRVTKKSSAIVLFAQTPFDKVLGASNLKNLRYEWIWEKPAATGFFNAKKMPLKAHENILVFYETLPTYNPIKTFGHKRKTAGRVDVNSEVYGKAVKKVEYDSTERYPRSVLRFSSDKQRKSLHPTQKPLDLVKYLIETYSNADDVVLDFCMGSGTAGEAAMLAHRSFIGIEKDTEIFNIAKNRVFNSKNSEAA